jgi:acetoin utilization deacetylase AcuC-like enzyme
MQATPRMAISPVTHVPRLCYTACPALTTRRRDGAVRTQRSIASTVITVLTPDTASHHPPHEFTDGRLVPLYESPLRATLIEAALRHANLGPILMPDQWDDQHIRAVHPPEYLEYLAHAYRRWVAAGGSPEAVLPGTFAVRGMSRRSLTPLAAPGYYSFDLSAPIVAGTYAAARTAADAALTAARHVQAGASAAYALCRPPGHHAGPDLCGGYCFLNNAAIAAEYLRRRCAGRCVAILDIDFHHGNGTQHIFEARDDVLFVSLHADPAEHYPYFSGYADEIGRDAGRGWTHNLVLPAGTDDASYLAALDAALALIGARMPAALIVSLGVDTAADDPVAAMGASFALSAAAFHPIGARIATLGLPTVFVQEGGYAVDALGRNVAAVLTGFASVVQP